MEHADEFQVTFLNKICKQNEVYNIRIVFHSSYCPRNFFFIVSQRGGALDGLVKHVEKTPGILLPQIMYIYIYVYQWLLVSGDTVIPLYGRDPANQLKLTLVPLSADLYILGGARDNFWSSAVAHATWNQMCVICSEVGPGILEQCAPLVDILVAQWDDVFWNQDHWNTMFFSGSKNSWPVWYVSKHGISLDFSPALCHCVW